MKSSPFRKILSGLSLTTAMFIFQACYGGPQDYGIDFLVEGQVKSKSSGLPLQGIKVTVADSIQYTFTDTEGRFSLYSDKYENLKIIFEDIDSVQNGFYISKDTLIPYVDGDLYFDINLEDK